MTVDAPEVEQAPFHIEHVRRPPVPETPGRSTTAEDPYASLSRLASATGNRAFSRVVARMRDGDGILSGGLVHPDVEAAIAAASGGGRSIDRGAEQHASRVLGGSFGDVRVHTDDHAAALNRAVSARAFTVGNDIFFGSGEYKPETPGGRELLTHELAHVVQQRGAPRSGQLTVSQPGDALEREAEAAARGA